ncbi:MAG: hypothetical protein ABH849_02880 [Nanoarchaeota archaeon]
MKILLALLVLLLLPSVTSFSCLELEGQEQEYCNEIEQMELTNEERDYLIASLFDIDFDDIFDYNTNIEFDEAPLNVEIENDGYIENAWVKIIYISPSIYLDDDLIIDDQGEILTRFGYEIDLPDDNDCDTEYSVVDEDVDLVIYQGEEIIGYDEIVSFDIDRDKEFKAKLKLKIKTKIKHYELIEGECELEEIEYRTDSVIVYDSVDTKLIDEGFDLDFEIINKYHETTKGILQADNFNKLTLEFEESYYEYEKFIVELDYDLLPYYVLTPKATRQDVEKSQNIFIERDESIEFSVKNPEDCLIKISSFFNDYEYECDLDYEEILLDIKTDKITYNENETIKVFIEADEQVKISYGEEVKYSSDYVEFQAIPKVNRVTAETGYAKDYRIINVRSEQYRILLSNLGVFVCINYFILKIFKFKRDDQ